MEKDPVDMLERSHRRLEETLADLKRALAEGDAEVFDESMAFLHRSGKNHVADEEESIFPRLGSDAAGLVEQLRNEHREQERLLEELGKVHPRDAMALAEKLDVLYRAHTRLEDEELLPLVAQLDDAVRGAAREEMQARRGKRR